LNIANQGGVVTVEYHNVASRRRGVAPWKTAGRLALPAALSLNALNGCSVGDDYHNPGSTELARWRTIVNGRYAWPTPTWWRRFHSRRLDTLMQLAKEHNFIIRAAIDRIRQADAQAVIARAPLFPFVGANGQVQRGQTPQSSSGGSVKPALRDNVLFQFNASVPNLTLGSLRVRPEH
jgi:multidrug efflux system outer membrane protein